jgi:hypothetical protein
MRKQFMGEPFQSSHIAGKPVNMLQALHAEMDARSIEAAQED